MVLIVIVGLEISSRRYNRRREGRAKVIKTMAGDNVQTASSSWLSYGALMVYFEDRREYMINMTYLTISVMDVMAWSWKRDRAFMVGEVGSWRESCPHNMKEWEIEMNYNWSQVL